MKRAAPVDQRRKNDAYRQANPLLPGNRSKQKQRAFDAAKDYFKRYRTPLTDSLQTIFGTEFFARAALWLDPLTPFRNSAGIIGYETRTRQRDAFRHNGFSKETVTVTSFTNREDDNSEVVPEYPTSEPFTTQTDYENLYNVQFISYIADSTSKSRGWETSYASGEVYSPYVPTYGTMKLQTLDSEYYFPNIITKIEEDYAYYYNIGEGVTHFYNVERRRFTFDVVESITYPAGPPIFDDLDEFALEFMNEHVFDMIQGALASRRSFNLAYQIAELKDLPRLLSDIKNLQSLVTSYIKDPLGSIAKIDKDIANLNLSWEFGVKSLAGAVKGLMKLPTKATKRLNYLISRNGKVSTGRSSRKWINYENPKDEPYFEFVLPDWIEHSDVSVSRRFDIELRCVVNQTIQFPAIAVPSITDKDYRRLIGLPLSVGEIDVKDAYDLIPFSWLTDWFTGLGSYIGIMSAIHQDTQLVNYGFLTIVINETVTHKVNLKATSNIWRHFTDEFGDVHEIENTGVDKVYPYERKYTRKYQRRVDIGSLEGVKSFGWYQTNLSAFQQKILGSLFSQRL